MRSVVTAIIAAIESAAVAIAGIALIALPALLLWILTFKLSAEPATLAGGVVAIWFLAHLTPISFPVTAEAAVGLGLPQQAFEYPLSLAPLGLTLITAILAVRSGWRFGRRGGMGVAGVAGGFVGFGLVSFAFAPVAAEFLGWPAWLAALVAGAVYATCSAAGFVVRAARDEHAWWEYAMRQVQRGISAMTLPGAASLPDRAAAALRLAAMATCALLGLSAVSVVIAIVGNYGQVVKLSQALQLDAVGAFAVFLLQLVMLPVLIIWLASWLTGAGFALGTGSLVSPFETLVGPVPMLPVFGAIPDGEPSLGAVAPALVVITGAVVGAFFARRPMVRRLPWVAVLSVGAAAAAICGLTLAGAGALASGAIGPARLADTGPDIWLFAGLAAAELGGGMLLGIAGSRVDLARVRWSGAASGEEQSSEHGPEGALDEDYRETVPLDGLLRNVEGDATEQVKVRGRSKGRAGLAAKLGFDRGASGKPAPGETAVEEPLPEQGAFEGAAGDSLENVTEEFDTASLDIVSPLLAQADTGSIEVSDALARAYAWEGFENSDLGADLRTPPAAKSGSVFGDSEELVGNSEGKLGATPLKRGRWPFSKRQ